MAAPQQVPNPRRLFVGNLSPKVEENDVRLFFQDVGDIDSIEFPGIGVGYCHINFATKRGARRAMREKNNRRLEGQRVWCNLKLKPKKDKFEGHIILEQDIMVLNDINDINRVRGVLEAKYEKCGGADGRVVDVLLPKHLIEKNKGRAFIRFNTKQAVEDALILNNRQRSEPNIRVPTYTAHPAENIHSGGSGGIYGFETEKGDYVFEDHKYYKAPQKITFT